MRLSAETLNSGGLGMGWWVRGLLLGAYNNTTHHHFFHCNAMRAREKSMDFSGWVGASAEDTSSPNGARPSAHTFGTTTAQAPWLMLLPNIRIYPTVYLSLIHI